MNGNAEDAFAYRKMQRHLHCHNRLSDTRLRDNQPRAVPAKEAISENVVRHIVRVNRAQLAGWNNRVFGNVQRLLPIGERLRADVCRNQPLPVAVSCYGGNSRKSARVLASRINVCYGIKIAVYSMLGFFLMLNNQLLANRKSSLINNLKLKIF